MTLRIAAVSSFALGLVVQGAFAQGADPNPPTGVEIEIGVGSRIGGPEVSNYRSSNGVLSLTNLGRATPQFLTGLGFIPCSGYSTSEKPNVCKHQFVGNLGAFVTANFGGGGSDITGYTIGATFGLGKHLRALAGFSLTPINQISPGFALAASQYVAKNPSAFPGINSADLSKNSFGAFDGIQFTNTAPTASSPTPVSTIYYAGAVTETHYRGGLMIGVALPIDVYNLLKGK